jgi:hypothetical protein
MTLRTWKCRLAVLAMIAGAGTCLAGSQRAPLSDLSLGEHLYGDRWDLPSLTGRTVVLAYWGAT